jgi:hypothetical protein
MIVYGILCDAVAESTILVFVLVCYATYIISYLFLSRSDVLCTKEYIMLPDPITLTYDADHDGGTTPDVVLEYSRAEEAPGRSMYQSENHKEELRDLVSFYRTRPKVNGNFRGVMKSSVKYTVDISVDSVIGPNSPIIAPIIVECTFSIPVGATDAEVLDARQRMVATLNDDDVMNALNLQLIV